MVHCLEGSVTCVLLLSTIYIVGYCLFSLGSWIVCVRPHSLGAISRGLDDGFDLGISVIQCNVTRMLSGSASYKGG